ncbi:MAG: hypothetical protein A2W52_01350 [Candidatus Taylorbacteria bacterium RIFCSPHIGHO2_02_49_25]|uniref:Uncharacterized protein n=1 Tax=Candidatus Taylorbacteria bacterium RIFCSPHIGHO2_02_49_25 TaxID=1802305 RepID=A0A1G2MBD8_9BACT|nr:MAG: hypothetical protein A2W52_01350 [Candidatus Taylorbacteria bacterium RIFCSPHIGHO2_02_49_25]OHA35336.1 MAG: hypothetical protein A2W65_02455 [Candidatus Taylorbacteria bacterium RIFCSPLOWO2_02_50_13]OHA36924.1 MAG: hypothetical protein A3B27_01400 [Candidatus Taylorbacteria bacterium RIFCSPLOWO2_01_FULL_50_130]HCB35592.1 hypothetical protein [Candidatus Taylorbacteria bacterium]
MTFSSFQKGLCSTIRANSGIEAGSFNLSNDCYSEHKNPDAHTTGCVGKTAFRKIRPLAGLTRPLALKL